MEKPTFKQKVDSFCTFIYNSEKGELLGRGGKSWAEITFFYLIYYICLSGFFCATIAVFYQTVDEHFPKLQHKSSLLDANPGLGYKPMPDIETTLVHVKPGNEADMVESIDKVLNAYGDRKNNVDCPKDEGTRPDAKESCYFDRQPLKDFCNASTSYGYAGSNPQPCILLKLNKIFGWTPEISETKPEGLNIDEGLYKADKIWIECVGENGADKDNMGEVTYYPQQGFPLEFYPYKNQDNYMAPLVMVKFENPLKRMGMMIMCKAYAKNIKIDPTEKQGSVQFELLIESPQ